MMFLKKYMSLKVKGRVFDSNFDIKIRIMKQFVNVNINKSQYFFT